MDVQRTMEFILEQQAQMTTRQDSILKLIHSGMKLVAEHDRQIKALIDSHERLAASLHALAETQQATEERLNRLASSQQDTDERLKRLIDALRRPRGNGKKGPPRPE